MKNIIIYFNDFDPINLANIDFINKSLKIIDNPTIYLGLNRKSRKDNLSPFLIRKTMLKYYLKNNKKLNYSNLTLDFSSLKESIDKIKSKFNKDNNYYIMIDNKDYLKLQNNLNVKELKKYCNFIISASSSLNLDKSDIVIKTIEFDNKMIINRDYSLLEDSIKEYIETNNIYLKRQIRPYLTLKRYYHSISVANTAVLINNRGGLGLDSNKVFKTGLLHDIAKYLDKDLTKSIMHNYYKEYENENYKILHQYLGEYIAKKDFNVTDKDMLNAIKYHTTGRSNMSLMEKLIYVSDKIEPTRPFETKSKIELCIKDFNKGFINVLKHNKEYLESKTKVTNKDTLECFNYYLK